MFRKMRTYYRTDKLLFWTEAFGSLTLLCVLGLAITYGVPS